MKMGTKVWEEKLPKFLPVEKSPALPHEVVIAEGWVEVSKLHTEIPDELHHTFRYVGGFKHENGWSNLANVEDYLAHLNGCLVRITMEVQEYPK